MSDLSDFISPDGVDASLMVSSKKSLLSQLALVGARLTGLGSKDIGAALVERERAGSTGFGGGIAIPHARIPGLTRIHGYFARLGQPLPYQAVDQMPVDLVFMMLSPPDAGAEHLKALARVSRALRDKQMLAKLRGAQSRDALYAVLTGGEARDAA
jgi:PTS system nitrogen regulatory IIA component